MADRQARRTGRVIAAHGRRGRLESESGDRLPYLIRGRRLQVVCGDHVEWVMEDRETLAVITGIAPRSNVLERQPPGRPGPEILAANLSLMIVICAPRPEPDWFLVDRYLCTGALMDCRLLLASNKSDLTEPQDQHLAMLEQYRHIGYTCLTFSALTNEGIDILRDILHDQTAILVGQSGVGKSSLINHLVPNADIATGPVSAATREGVHTTTASAMHDLPGGGRLIDTPGVRDFIPVIPEPQSVQKGFPEILTAAGHCRFANCRHLREPQCGVKDAVSEGTVTERRYESYKRLIHIIAD